MNYQALYRKYRPSNFNDVSGQDSTIKILKNSLKLNKTSHAYLFYGPRGTGKTSVAKIFARSINCLDNKEGIQCEECDNCLISKEKECIDIVEIDAASNNGVDEIRELKNKVSFVPAQLKYKVYIIDEVHMLSTGAFNALLKTLEEPPSYVIFILATTELQKVPSTIISRCQVLEFRKLTNQQIVNRLRLIADNENIKVDDESLLEIAKRSNGGLRDAIGLFEKVALLSDNNIDIQCINRASNNVSTEELNEFKELLFKKDINKVISKINDFYDSGIDFVAFINSLIDSLTNDYVNSNYLNTNISSIIINLDKILSSISNSNNQKLLFEIQLLNLLQNTEETNTAINQKNTSNNTKTEEIKEEKNIVDSKEIESKTINIDNSKNESNNIKELRVGNTLSKANKEIISNIRKDWSNISNLAFDTKYGNVARLLSSDIIPVAASDEYVVLNSKLSGLAEQINNDLNSVENIFEIIFNYKYKAICITEEEWKNYIALYKKDKTHFVYKEETEKQKNDKKKSLKEKAKELFED